MKRERRSLLGGIERGVGAVGKYLALFGTALKLVQFLPLVAGFLIVFFSPSAWLSGTLRLWALSGVAIGSLAGIGALAVVGPRPAHRQGLVTVLLAVVVASAAVLRVHLAVVDLAFLERWPVLQPLHDFYLGSDLGERLYNALAAGWFAATLFAATLGLPLWLAWRRERALAAATDERGGADVAAALTAVTAGVETLQRTAASLREENRTLKEELAAREATIERLRLRLDAVAKGPGRGREP